MFFPGSRYEKAGTYLVEQDGRAVRVTRTPPPRREGLRGFHPRRQGERLDLLAHHYLADATAFWRLCDANNAVVPDALAARLLIGVPQRSTVG